MIWIILYLIAGAGSAFYMRDEVKNSALVWLVFLWPVLWITLSTLWALDKIGFRI